MNVPSHLLINLAVLARHDLGRLAWPVAFGAVLPDLAAYAFYAYYKLVERLPEEIIWGQLHPSATWQAVFAPFHALPLFALAFILFAALKSARGMAFASSLLLHGLVDLPLHHTDAPRHFFPLSDWRFRSPLSYWDRAHHAGGVAVFELAAGLLACVWLWPKLRARRARATVVALFAGLCALYASGALFWNTSPVPVEPPPGADEPGDPSLGPQGSLRPDAALPDAAAPDAGQIDDGPMRGPDPLRELR